MNSGMKENSMNEVSLSEMRQANGGIQPIAAGIGAILIGGVLIAVAPDQK